MIDFAKLTAPFSPDDIHWRVGATTQDKKKGMALAYMDARAVMDRLDAVCGPGGWQCRYPHANGKTVCEIGLLIGDNWIWKADGAGDTDHEAEKGALSDAFKRAAFRWGIGRYLYDLTSPWVEIEQYGKSYKIKESEHAKLRGLLGGGSAGPKRGKEAAATPSADSPPPTPAQKAKAWADAALLEIAGLETIHGLMDWREYSDAAMAKLSNNHPQLYEAVQGAYEKAKRDLAQINTLSAA